MNRVLPNAAHRRLGHLGHHVLVDEPLPDPLRRVPLVARRLPIRSQPLVDRGRHGAVIYGMLTALCAVVRDDRAVAVAVTVTV